MKIGYYQYAPFFHDVQANHALAVERLSSVEADLIVLPELSMSGYLFKDEEDARRCSEPIPGLTSDLFSALSKQTGTAFVYGCIESDERGMLYNSSVCTFPDGRLELYRKTHLFNREKLIFSPGSIPYAVFQVNGVAVGMLVCFDHMFPEAARSLALLGVQVICHPSNLVLEGIAQITTRSRSIENRVFWILANRTGTEQSGKVSCTYTGASQITSPDGRVLVSSARDGEELCIIKIDPDLALSKRITSRNDVLADRRTDLYYRENGGTAT